MIGLSWNSAAGGADLVLAAGGGGVVRDGTLRTSVILSLFLDARARPDDGAGADRRGWIGDAFTPEDRIGSRLWLLTREKQTEETRRRAQDYATEALAWLVEDGLATAATVSAEWIDRGVLALEVRISTPSGLDQSTFVLRL